MEGNRNLLSIRLPDADGRFRRSKREVQAFADACGIEPGMIRVNQESGQLELKSKPELKEQVKA